MTSKKLDKTSYPPAAQQQQYNFPWILSVFEATNCGSWVSLLFKTPRLKSKISRDFMESVHESEINTRYVSIQAWTLSQSIIHINN